MELSAEIYQFLSRPNLPNISIGFWKWYPYEYPDILIEIDYCICDKPFEINFTNVVGRRPDCGAYTYVDPLIDKFMSKRWPKCIKGKVKITSSSSDIMENEILVKILKYLRFLIWDIKNSPDCLSLIRDNLDQTATTNGYRREFIHQQMLDFVGNRAFYGSDRYVSSEIGDYIGPGLAYIIDLNPFEKPNEYVWSSIIPFRKGINIETDLPVIQEKIASMRKHYNSYNELEDAISLFKQGHIKSSIRSAASSVDAILRFYCVSWDIKFPSGNLQFDLKIEKILSEALMPSYEKADSENLTKLLYLYRARNSMHEGDCYYKNNAEQIIYITDLSQVEDFIKSVETFTLWIDALV